MRAPARESNHLHVAPGAEVFPSLGVNGRTFQLFLQLLLDLAHKIAISRGNPEPNGTLRQAKNNLAASQPGAIDLGGDGISDLRDKLRWLVLTVDLQEQNPLAGKNNRAMIDGKQVPSPEAFANRPLRPGAEEIDLLSLSENGLQAFVDFLEDIEFSHREARRLFAFIAEDLIEVIVGLLGLDAYQVSKLFCVCKRCAHSSPTLLYPYYPESDYLPTRELAFRESRSFGFPVEG